MQVAVAHKPSGADVESFAHLEIAPRFWELINESGANPQKLRTLLAALDREDLIRFAIEFDYAVNDLVSQCVEEKGDTYHEEDAAGWVVSQGVRQYAKVFDHPEEFPDEVPDWNS